MRLSRLYRRSRVLRWLRRRPLRAGLLGLSVVGLGVFMLTPAIIIERTWFIPHPDQRPSALPAAMPLVAQHEPHTCGYLAMSMIYAAYGLDARAERVRARLGTDIRALFYVADSTGAFHPDIQMVFAQDHFHVENLPAAGGRWQEPLRRHVADGHLALVLIRRPVSGNLHWVACGAGADGGLQVHDSLAPAPYALDAAGPDVISVIAVRPAGGRYPAGGSLMAHADGAGALLAAVPRMMAD